MLTLLISLIFGAIIVFLASSNANLVEVSFGLVKVTTPLFVTMAVCFLMGFATAVFAFILRVVRGNGQKSLRGKPVPGKGIVVRR
jgi:uncharacterized integral membrane protein